MVGVGRCQKNISDLLNNIISGTKQVGKDLFLYPGSFYFESDISRVEFSHKILLLTVLLVLFLSVWMFIKIKKTRLPILLSLLLGLTSLLVGNFSGDLPGIRRSAGVLASFYTLYILAWNYVIPSFSKIRKKSLLSFFFLRILIMFALLLVVFHHFKVYRYNLAALYLPSNHAADACFNKIPGQPAKSLEKYVSWAQNGEVLYNTGEDEGGFVCRLHAIYAASAGSCKWNHLNCPPIYGYDENTGNNILLSTGLWESYYFGH